MYGYRPAEIGLPSNAESNGMGDILFLPESFDIQIGNAVEADVEKQFGGIYVDRPDWTAYVNEVGQRVARHSKRPDRKYTFQILDSDILNAFALPNGNIYVTRGLLLAMQNEAQLAGVLGHEVGHVADRHGMQQYQTAMGLSLLASRFIDEDTSETKQSLVDAAMALIVTGFSRNDELEADAIGVKSMQRAGYNPNGIVQLMEILSSAQTRQPDLVESFFQTHPPTAERIQDLESRIMLKYGEEPGQILNEPRYQRIIHGRDVNGNNVGGIPNWVLYAGGAYLLWRILK